MEGERYSNYLEVNKGLKMGVRFDNVALRSSGAAGLTFLADWATFSANFNIKHSHDGVHYKSGAFHRRMDFYAAVLARDPSVSRYIWPR
jgi:hypothetical protein